MFAALVTIGRYLLFIYHGKEGVFIGKLLSDGLLVPLCLVFLQYWYIKTVWTLYGKLIPVCIATVWRCKS